MQVCSIPVEKPRSWRRCSPKPNPPDPLRRVSSFMAPSLGPFSFLPMKPALVPEWRLWWRLWSVRLPVLGGAILTFIEAFPDAFVSFWLAAPPDIRAAIDPETIRWIGIGLVFAGAFARVI